MNFPTRRLAGFLVLVLFTAGPMVPPAPAQEQAEPKKDEKPAEPPRSASGKKLLTGMDVLRIAGVGGVALSPDGQRVAYTVSETSTEKDKEWKSTTHVWVVSVSGGPAQARQYTRGEKSASSPQWSPDGKYLAFLTNREKDAERQVWFLWADGGEAWQVTTHKGGVSGFAFSPDSKTLLLLAQDPLSKEEEEKRKVKDDTQVIDQDFRMTHLWLWDIEKKEAQRLTEGNFTCSDAHWSPDGAHISYTVRPTPKADDGDITDIWVLDLASSEKRKLAASDAPESAARWSPDGKWIAYVGSAKGGVYQDDLFLIPAAGGTPKNLTAAFDLDAGTAHWSPDGKTLYFTSTQRQAVEVFAADAASGGVKQLSQHGGVASLAAISRDGKTAVGTVSDARRPSDVYRTDLSFRKLERITGQNAWLDEYALGEVELRKWQSTDGTQIEGVLTKPVDYDASKKYPLLLHPHGGPTGASLTGFYSTAQLMAANGYLVLQPNFRGSTGRGEAFAQANKNTWGKGDYEDCISGVQAAVDRGLADPERLGAFGWSYGGYMTFWILTQTDMFKAVSPGAGVSNIYSMYSQNDIQRYLRWFYADQSPWDNFDLYWDRSPMKYVKNVKTPTLIVHGERDTRVPIAQAQEFYRALVERGVPVEFVVFPREGHGISEPRHQLDRLRRWLSFFGKYLDNPPRTEPQAEAAEEK